MCQFELACKELQIAGEWVVEDFEVDLLNEQTEYIASWRIDNI